MIRNMDAALFARLCALEQVAGTSMSVSELRRELSLTFPERARALVPGEEDYPDALEVLSDPPKVLCALGDLSFLSRQMRIAMVGSRDASPERCEAATLLSADLAARGAVIISGLAAGIDRAAHEGALGAWTRESRQGRTVAVLGTPLSMPWPPENARLYEDICSAGLVLSEVPQAEGRRFDPEERSRALKRRNRIVAALSVGTVVMAARPGSSTLIEMRAALNLGRPVLIWHACRGEAWAEALVAENLVDGSGRSLVQFVRDAAEVEERLSPWSTVWWL